MRLALWTRSSWEGIQTPNHVLPRLRVTIYPIFQPGTVLGQWLSGTKEKLLAETVSCREGTRRPQESKKRLWLGRTCSSTGREFLWLDPIERAPGWHSCTRQRHPDVSSEPRVRAT